MGRWSELSACRVFHERCLCNVSVAEVMSGDVRCWFVLFGTLVGVFLFSVMWSEFCMMSAMSVPLWSSVYECQSVECAFMSPVMIEFVSVVRCVKQLVMSVSSVWWFVSVVSRGGMYMFDMCMCLFLFRCSLNVWSSVFCVFMC